MEIFVKFNITLILNLLLFSCSSYVAEGIYRAEQKKALKDIPDIIYDKGSSKLESCKFIKQVSGYSEIEGALNQDLAIKLTKQQLLAKAKSEGGNMMREIFYKQIGISSVFIVGDIYKCTK